MNLLSGGEGGGTIKIKIIMVIVLIYTKTDPPLTSKIDPPKLL